MTDGWIVNLWSLEETRRVQRSQPPVCFNGQGEPIFEIWFWHAQLQTWFVMAAQPSNVQGVVFFHPDEVPEQLRERVRAMEQVLA